MTRPTPPPPAHGSSATTPPKPSSSELDVTSPSPLTPDVDAPANGVCRSSFWGLLIVIAMGVAGVLARRYI